MTSPRTSLAIAALCALTSSASAQDMIGVSWQGNVYSMDSATGTGTQIGTTGFPNGSGIGTNSMTIAQGVVWITYTSGSNMTDFQVVDMTTGAATPVSTAPIDIRGLAFDGTSTMYAVANSSPDMLHTVDPTTGMITVVGSTGFSGIQGLAHDGTNLYAWDIFDGLLVIDTATGAATDVSLANGGLAVASEGQFLTADPGGNLFTGRGNLYSIDKTDGTAMLVGPGSGFSDVRGADFVCTISTVGPGCAGTSGIPQLTMNPCPASPGRITAITSNGLPNSPYGIGIGFPNTSIPLPNGCVYHVGVGSFFLSVLDGSGQETFNLVSSVPPGFSGLVLRTQSLVADPGAPGGFVATPGLEFALQ